jgi:predicted short-subunit dehydrogenase-like oxidoreductase (DUF2520 family)
MFNLHLHGPGRAATSCAAMATHAGVRVVGLSGGSAAGAVASQAVLGDIPWTPTAPAAFTGSTLIVVGVPDDALDEAAVELARSDYDAHCAAVHLSGIRGRDALDPLANVSVATGAFHPLMSFPTRDPGEGDLDGALVAIETEASLASSLRDLAQLLGGRPFAIDPSARATYHLGASVASNTLLAVLDLARAAFEAAGVPADLATPGLVSLMSGTLDNAASRGVADAVTGPVARGDVATLRRHLEALDTQLPEHRALYMALVRGLLAVCERRSDAARAAVVRAWIEEAEA